MLVVQVPKDNAVVMMIPKIERRSHSPRSVSEAPIDMILKLSQILARGVDRYWGGERSDVQD